MPLYKGSSEVTSGNLHKGSTEIENGYKGTDIFYLNETTISWATPTGGGFTYSTPTPQSSTGSPGTAFTSTTFTITAGSNALTGTATISGLPPGLSTSQSYNNSGPGNILTITISGTFPTTSYLNTALTVSGLSGVTYYTLTVNYSSMAVPTSNFGTTSVGASATGSAINTTDNGSTWTGQYPAGDSVQVSANWSSAQPGFNTAHYFEQWYFSSGYSGALPTLTGDVTSWSSGTQPPNYATSFSKYSNSFTMNGNKTVNVSGGYSIVTNSNWGYQINATHSGSSSSAVFLSVSAFGNWQSLQRSCSLTSSTNSGVFLSYFTQSGGTNYKSYASGTILAGDFPQQIQVYTSATGSSVYNFNWGGNTLQTTVTFS